MCQFRKSRDFQSIAQLCSDFDNHPHYFLSFLVQYCLDEETLSRHPSSSIIEINGPDSGLSQVAFIVMSLGNHGPSMCPN